MDDGSSPVSILLLMGFILLEAVFYGFGAAIQNVNEGKLDEDVRNGSKKAARLAKIVNRPGRFVNTIQITTHLVGIITGIFILPALIQSAASHFQSLTGGGLDELFAQNAPQWFANPLWWKWAVLTLVTTLILLILIVCFGIIIPKRLAAKEPERWGYRMLPVVVVTATILLPLTTAITLLAKAVLKLFGVEMTANDENVTEEDIMSMVNEGHEQGLLEAGETQMITNIFELGEKAAWDAMTHRTNMVVLDDDLTLQEAVDFILHEGTNSRYPITGEDMDDIIGILHIRDAMTFYANPENRTKMIKEIPGILREASFVPETRSLDTLFQEMQSKKIHMEIVVDEYGQTAGLLTMEDILEEIVGNIMDEYDEEEDFIQKLPDGSYRMSGMTPLDDVMKTLDVEFPEEDCDTYDTLNGYLSSRFGRILQENERPFVDYASWRFQVQEVGSKMIESILVSQIAREEVATKENEQMGDTDESNQSDKGNVS